jgi:nucleotide-binding universal stress UspA family protein
MSTILLATDGSPSSMRATAAAIQLAEATGWRLHVVTVWKRPVWEYGLVPEPVYELDAHAKAHGEEALAAAVKEVEAAGMAVDSSLRSGDAGGEICAAAEELGAELIVVGSHGWTGLRRLVLGSVSAKVLHEAPCPVLVVRRGAARAAEPQKAEEVVAAR